MHEKYRGYRKFIPLRPAVPATRNERKYFATPGPNLSRDYFGSSDYFKFRSQENFIDGILMTISPGKGPNVGPSKTSVS